MAADAGHGQSARWYLGGSGVGAAGAKVRAACQCSWPGPLPAGLDGRQAFDHTRRQTVPGQASPYDLGHQHRREHAAFGQQGYTVLVVLADHARAPRPVVSLFLQLGFDKGAAFLDHQDFFQALGERAQRQGFERPGHAHLVDRNAQRLGHFLVDTHLCQSLAHVRAGLP